MIPQDLTPIATSPTPSTLFYGSPDLVSTGEAIVSKVVEFGASGHVNGSGQLDRSIFHRSLDGGETFSLLSTFDGFYFGVFIDEFCIGDDLLMIGNSSGDGDIVALSSSDGGGTWSSSTLFSGASEDYRLQETAYLIHEGRILIAAITGTGGYPHESICMIHAAIADDLTDSASWTRSATLTRNIAAMPAAFYNSNWGINEPNVVLMPSGAVKVRARIDTDNSAKERSLIAILGWDGTALTWDRIKSFDGGYTKSMYVPDPVSGDYFVARNSCRVNDGLDRRTLCVLDRSSDLVTWRRIAILGQVDESFYASQAHQYPSICIDGDDMIFALRSADAASSTYHDTNLINFGRVENFRKL
jgi:hypothetical protein